MPRTHIQPDEKLPLKLTATERKLVLGDLMILDQYCEQIIRETPSGKPVMMTLDDLDVFGGYVAAEANHCEDKKREKKLDDIFGKIQRLLDKYTDEEPPQILKIEDAITAEQAKQKLTKGISDVVAGKAPATISFRLKSKTPKSAKFPIKMTQHQRESLLLYTRLKAAIKRNVEAADDGTQMIDFTKKELDHMHDEIGQAVVYARSPHKQRLVAVQKKVDDILEEIQLEDFGFERPKQGRRPASTSDLLIQLKVTLFEIRPTIWRRIQIKDCTLGDLHEHIQTAMGWENCHMHEFVIDGERYGTAMPDDFGFGDEIKNESKVRLSELLPKNGKRYRFQYVYDFGDDWRHEILFEGYPPLEKAKKYPLCLEGERACPPDDIGGPWGFAEYLDALSDSDHERHDEFMEWSGSFDPEDFSVEQVAKAMQKGLPR